MTDPSVPTFNLKQLRAEAAKRKQKSGDQLAPGDWLAPGELLDGAAEVLHTLTYRPSDHFRRSDNEKHVHLVVREQDKVAPYADVVAGSTLFDLATEADLAALRESAERAQRIADIRALADFLEAHPALPMNSLLVLQVASEQGGDVWDSGDEGAAEVRGWAEIMGAKVEEAAGLVEATRHFGSASYKVVAFQKSGPWFNVGDRVVPRGWEKSQYSRAGLNVIATVVETKPITGSPRRRQQFRAEGADWCGGGSMWNHSDGFELLPDADPMGLSYTRADEEADDPTPVSGGRIPPHTGAVTEGGLVDETGPAGWHGKGCLGATGRPCTCEPATEAGVVDETASEAR
jgi:hypothetical protein